MYFEGNLDRAKRSKCLPKILFIKVVVDTPNIDPTHKGDGPFSLLPSLFICHAVVHVYRLLSQHLKEDEMYTWRRMGMQQH